MKKCKKCGGTGPFTSHPTTADRLYPNCAACERIRHKAYGKTPRGKAARAWTSMNWRSGNKTGRTPAYAAVEVRMTREQFMLWAVPAFTLWQKNSPTKVASVDRVKNTGHYAVENIRLIEKVANQLRSTRYKNLNGCPRGKAWCSSCKAYHATSLFSSCARTPNGLQPMCREAHRVYMRKYRTSK